MYQFSCDGDLVIVTQKPVSDFSGMQDPQEPYTDRYKTVGEKVNFQGILGLWGAFSNIIAGS